MGNLGFKIKRFFQNKNTVTIIGVVLMVGIVYFGYQWRVKKDTTPVRVPCAAVTIQPRTKITEDMIEYIEVSPTMVNSSTLKDIRNIVGKWSNYNSLIPEGSLFFTSAVVAAEELPDSAFISISEGFTPFNLSVNITSTYGNSIFPNNYIDIYFTGTRFYAIKYSNGLKTSYISNELEIPESGLENVQIYLAIGYYTGRIEMHTSIIS